MAVQELLDFQDIFTAIAEAVKVQSTDTTNINRIKRWVNLSYIDEVVPTKRWWWLRSHTTVKISPKLTTGNASVVQDSPTVTLSSAPATSKVGEFFTSNGAEEIYRIITHTAGSPTITLDSDYIGETVTDASYQIWPYRFALPSDCKETIEIYTDRFPTPLNGVGLQEFRRIMQEIPKREGIPNIYTTSDFDSNGNRELFLYPAITTDRFIVQIDYQVEATALDLDGDVPLMPVEDRSILFLLGLAKAYEYITRDIEKATKTEGQATTKLALMASNNGDSTDLPVFRPSQRYLIRKRLPVRFRRRFSSLNFRKD